jgi:tRNA-2-methylthio-N6-dimethylallyladenosine synthase
MCRFVRLHRRLPGESAADFEANAARARAAPTGSFSFLYARVPRRRPNLRTRCPAEKDERLQRRSAVEAQASASSAAMVGTVQRWSKGCQRRSAEFAARTSNNRIVNFAGHAGLVDRFADLRITEARHFTLRGELAGAPVRPLHAA